MSTIDRHRLAQQLEREHERFIYTHPKSYELFQRAKKSFLAGVPMSLKSCGCLSVTLLGTGIRAASAASSPYLILRPVSP